MSQNERAGSPPSPSNIAIKAIVPQRVLDMLDVFSAHDLADLGVYRHLNSEIIPLLMSEWEEARSYELLDQERCGWSFRPAPIFGAMSLEDRIEEAAAIESGLDPNKKHEVKLGRVSVVMLNDLTCLLGRNDVIGDSLHKATRIVSLAGFVRLSSIDALPDLAILRRETVQESRNASLIKAYTTSMAGYVDFAGCPMEEKRVSVSLYSEILGGLSSMATLLGWETNQMIRLALAAGLAQSTSLISGGGVKEYALEVLRFTHFLEATKERLLSALGEGAQILKKFTV